MIRSKSTFAAAAAGFALVLAAATASAQMAGGPAPGLPGMVTDSDIIVEMAPVIAPDFARSIKKHSAAEREKYVAEFLDTLKDFERERLRWASDNLRENGSLLNARATTFLTLGPPVRLYDEPSHDWKGESIPRVDELLPLVAMLVPDPKAGAPAPPKGAPITLSAPVPTQAWVYGGKSVTEQRVVWFVDEDKDGSWRFAKDETLPASTAVSSATPLEAAANLFPPVGEGMKFKPMPVLAKDQVGLAVTEDFFKAASARTFVRIMVVVDPSDVEMELSIPPTQNLAKAQLWLHVDDASGKTIHQESVALAGLASATDTAWLVEVGVPLAPGDYKITALLTDADDKGNGGRKVFDVTVPAYAEGLALSSAVVAKSPKGSGEGGLPSAQATPDGSLQPFQIGNFIVRPELGSVFGRGDTLALVVQVYGSQPATLGYDLYYDGSFQNSTEPQKVDQLPSTEIQLFEITPAYKDGSYAIKVTASDPKVPAVKVEREVKFRVKGGLPESAE